ncbi:tRNA pseudouridine(38-40) synthase TruA [Dawidia soli]|uniref:tRNA pseudouridine synthase A n=1 Tax=Dawidia soli TaxID=2782352 RepID=A0AAP2DGX9_9BACT|nr:tRNA pseudouridine(38-40) synthase TruA [Dawidia soli]MBT1690866.1 tRNA pseudouridine(38-40) synthase TruA [Dawidia soli]
MRYFFEIAYHGAAYSGWQSQPNAVGIQAVVEDALTKLLREEISITGSGRTDAGVHCEQQFFHADIEKEFDRSALLAKLNSFLPKSIAIHSIRPVHPEASARYDAYERTYHYRITRVKDPFSEGLALHYFRPLDVGAMNRAAATMLGEHDFACFSKVQTDVNHFRCDMKKAEWREDGSRLEFTITANRFLRGMVRAIVGTLLDVGNGRTSLREFQAIVQSGDRKKAGANVAPHGLYLSRVKYHSRIFVKE